MALVTPLFFWKWPPVLLKTTNYIYSQIALLLWKKLAHLRTAKYVLYTA